MAESLAMDCSPERAAQDQALDRGARLTGCLALLTTSVFFGINVNIGVLLLPQVPPTALALSRCLLGLAALTPLVVARHGFILPRRRDLPLLALLGLLGFSLVYATFSWGMLKSQATSAAVIFASYPAMTNALLAIFWRSRPTGRQAAGIAAAFLGVLLVIARGSLANLLGLTFSVTDLILLTNVIAYSLYSILCQAAMRRYSPLTTSAFCLGLGGLFLLPIGVWEALTSPWRLDWTGWLMVLYMGCVVSGISVFLNLIGFERLGSGAAAVFGNLIPIVTIGLAILFMGEQLAFYHVLGLVLVLAGVALTIWGKRG